MRTSTSLQAVAALLALALMSTACGGATTPSGSGAQKTYTLRVTDEVALGFAVNDALSAWKADVERKSKGQLKIQLFPNGQLLKDKDAVPAVAAGTIEMNISTPGGMAQLVPALQLFDLPYVFKDDKQLENLWDTPLGTVLNQKLTQKGVRGVMILPLTGHIVLAGPKPIRTMADIKGTKIRTYGGAAQQSALQALGATGVTVPPTEIATALATGVINGLATGMAYWYGNFKDPLPYAIAPEMWHSPYAVWVNDKFWTSLPPELQKIVIDGFKNSMPVGQKVVDGQEASAMASGHVVVLSAADQVPWRQATANVPDQYTDKLGADVVAAIKKLQAQ